MSSGSRVCSFGSLSESSSLCSSFSTNPENWEAKEEQARLDAEAKEEQVQLDTLEEEGYPNLQIREPVGEGRYSIARLITYGKGEQRVLKLSKETIETSEYFKLTEKRMGGEWLALLEYGPNVLKTYHALARDCASGEYILVDAETVQGMFEDPEKCEGKDYTLIGTVSEYIEGAQTLEDYATTKGIKKVETLLKIAKQMFQALSTVHAKEIVHRDIKSENILVTPDGTLKLLDFGFALHIPTEQKTPSKKRRPLSICGTSYTIAPEVVFGGKYHTPADIYSIAATLIRVITGTLDYFGVGTSKRQYEVMQNQSQTLLGVMRNEKLDGERDKLENLIEGLSQYDPEQRLTAEKALEESYLKSLDASLSAPLSSSSMAASSSSARH